MEIKRLRRNGKGGSLFLNPDFDYLKTMNKISDKKEDKKVDKKLPEPPEMPTKPEKP